MGRNMWVILAACIPVLLYAAFVARYSVNVPNVDDWNAVVLVNSSAGGHLTWGELWMQHTANRMLIPNLVFVFVGRMTHENLLFIIALSTAIFVGGFVVFLALLRSFLARPLTPLLVIVTGAIWFSLVDWQNALWAFQFAWYLIILLLMVMLWLLLAARQSRLTLMLAALMAVAASLSSLQGLLLWPVGLICILWTTPWGGVSKWKPSIKWSAVAWVVVAAITFFIYFHGYQSEPGNAGNLFPTGLHGITDAKVSITYLFRQPVISVQFLLLEFGNVVPTSSASRWLGEAIGIVVLVGALYVVILGCRSRLLGVQAKVLPVALVTFAVLFDIIVASGRASHGVSQAVESRYSMFNLLLLLAIVIVAWDRISADALIGHVRAIAIGIILIVLCLQVGISADYGLTRAATSQRDLRTEARLATTTDLVISKERLCYAAVGLFAFGLPPLGGPLVSELEHHRLTIFSPARYRYFRSMGLPELPECSRA
jgi:hypothetical protein